MPFTTRCPDCRAKLRLPQTPDADENVECPKCGSLFLPEPLSDGEPRAEAPREKEPAPKKKKKKKEPKAKGPVAPKKRKIKKKKSNPVVLFSLLGVVGVFVISLVIGLVIYFGKVGKVDEMLSYIPGDCNLVRGINVGQVSKYPGFAPEIEPYITQLVKVGSDDIAKATGTDDGEGIRDYVIIAKIKKEKQQTGTMYIFRAKKGLPLNCLDGAPGMTPTQSGNTSYYRTKGKGILDDAALFHPTDRLFIVVPKGPHQQSMISAVASGGPTNRESMFGGKVGDTGKRVAAGNHWCLIQCDGAMRNYAKDMGESVKGAFPGFAKACSTAKAIGWWTSYSGKGISFGGGVDCGDSTGAYECKKSMSDGALGKGDESEIPNDFNRVFQGAKQKEFGEFLQYLNFTYTGSCAYFYSKMSSEKGKMYTSRLHGTSIAGWDQDSSSDGSGGGAPRLPGVQSGGGPGGRGGP